MKKFKRVHCVLGVVAVLVGGGIRAGAQALPTASGPGSNITVGGGYSSYQTDYDKRVIGGYFTFVDVHPTWRYGFEGESRYLRLGTDDDVKETTYLGGLHVYVRPQAFRPYVKFLAGMGRLDFPFGYAKGTYLALVPGAGIDYRLSDRITIRAVDFEYQEWPSFTFGSLHPYGISAGIAIRLNPVRRYPRH